jgi:hypothetical protein
MDMLVHNVVVNQCLTLARAFFSCLRQQLRLLIRDCSAMNNDLSRALLALKKKREALLKELWDERTDFNLRLATLREEDRHETVIPCGAQAFVTGTGNETESRRSDASDGGNGPLI